MTYIISHPKTLISTAHVKKRNNFKMNSQLKFNFHSDAKKLLATSVAIHATDLSSWKSTCEFTVEGNQSFVHDATALAQKLALLKSTCDSIEEKGL